MSSVCGVCNKVCGSDANVAIKCSKCGNVFHIACVKDDSVGIKTRSTKEWKCGGCRQASSTHSSSGGTPGTPLTKEFLVAVVDQLKKEVFGVVDQFKKEVFAEMETFKKEMLELSTTVQFVSDKLDSSTKLMETITTELANIKKENVKLQDKNARLSTEVEDLRERMRSLEQYTRRNNLEISGIPLTPNESVADIVRDVGVALGVEVQDSHVAVAHRIPSYRQDRSPAIVVQFHSRTTRDALIGGFREKKGLCASKVNSAFKQHRVYVNDHLSPENKQFLSKLKQKAKEVGYSYVWCREGKFFVRKASGEKARKIGTYVDLNKLK